MKLHEHAGGPKTNKTQKIKRKKKWLNRHSHTAATTWIKTRRQISTWDWLNLQNKNVKRKRKEKKVKNQK